MKKIYLKKSNLKIRQKTQTLCFISIFCALAISISFMEGLLIILPIMPPGFKPGFSNIITMFVVNCIGLFPAIVITTIKSLFVLLNKGTIAFIMSLCGGLGSTFVIYLLLKIRNTKISSIFLGISGAITHNLIQLFVSSIIISPSVYYYLPCIILFALITGSLTGLLIKSISPYLYKVFGFI